METDCTLSLDLIRFAYNELPATDRLAMQGKLLSSEALQDALENMHQVMDLLDVLKAAPKAWQVADLVAYAEATLHPHA